MAERTYETMTEVEAEIATILGDKADWYNVEAIAREVSDYEDGRLVADTERPDFWDICERWSKSFERSWYLLTGEGEYSGPRDDETREALHYFSLFAGNERW